MSDIKINDEMVSKIAFPLHVFGEVLDSEPDEFTREKVRYYRKKFLAQFLLDCSTGDKFEDEVYIEAFHEDLSSLLCSSL